ncbi:Signal transduction histidine-protein kinase BarA [Thalassovita gelatinovora]|uniref:histidine kinase n=1 Tax=Thalassovita gelatinovora TaxID=53501 RepID=A0A0P1FD47_THAGE|nr:ATP-binding protein [Thalassovita gelatinovora]QIZ80578.1 response regulator [Thalassovita gelatinovora]CUH66091.1 Signal transduction histidine-protein kinase BarA [Thalassovita gelatinovora]SEQ76769.1 His Kinase A (phospho-acceptor) domain-containing protein [Thalassovita gelatinovora]
MSIFQKVSGIKKLPILLVLIYLAALPFMFAVKRERPNLTFNHLEMYDDINALMQVEFRFRKLLDSVNEYRLHGSDSAREEILFHQEILQIRTQDGPTQNWDTSDLPQGGSMTVVATLPRMVDLIGTEVTQYLASNDPDQGRRLADKLQAYMFEFNSELIFLSDFSNQTARRQEINLVGNVQRDFNFLFAINVIMIAALSIFAYVLTNKERKLTERSKEVIASEEKSAAKTKYLASMSHEIRTPMQGIIGVTQILSSSDMKPDQKKNVGLIATSASTLLAIINDILDIAKIEAGRMELAPSPIDFRQTIEETVQLCSSIAREKDVDLTFSFSPNLPESIHADGTRLKQVLLNLCSNAIKFSAGQVSGRKGAVDVTFSAHEAGRAYFEVSDNGIGMSAEVVERLFSPYTQASADTSNRFGGTGLGLTISKQIVELMSGRIHVRSEPGVGSTFSVDFPVKKIVSHEHKIDLKHQAVIGYFADPKEASNLSGHIRTANGVYHDAQSYQQVVDLLHTFDAPPVVLLQHAISQDLLDNMIRITDSHPRVHFIVLASDAVPALTLPANCTVMDTKPLLPSSLLDALQNSDRTEARGVPGDIPEIIAPTATQNRKRILLAEDNQINQMVLRTQLSRMGYDVDIVGDGAQGLQQWSSAAYDLILSDCNMPVMNGIEFARKVRETETEQGRNKTPIIALTADAFEEQKIECLEAGMNDFLIKPTSIEELGDKLEFWLRNVTPPHQKVQMVS